MAQRRLVEQQLDHEKDILPFQAFHRAMNFLLGDSVVLRRQGGSMLEVGCGVGHYGVLVYKHYPMLNYYGTDASAAMIQHSLLPAIVVSRCDFEKNDFSLAKLLLLSQVLEMLEQPELALRWVLQQVRHGSYVILHRLRVDGSKESHPVQEQTYCGYPARNFIWNPLHLHEILRQHGDLVFMDYWEQSLTMVFFRS